MAETKFRPLLAAKVESEEDLGKLTYPVLVSPKLDGIRMICHRELGAVTRSLKPVPNKHIRDIMSNLAYVGLDGELVSGPETAPNVFNVTTSAVMTQDGKPDFKYLVFDNYHHDPLAPFEQRLERAKSQVELDKDEIAKFVYHAIVYTPKELLGMEDVYLNAGYEGIMIRSPSGHYKFNRSTFKEGILLKFKRIEEDEATVVDFEEKMTNANEAVKNALGYTERSDHKAGWVPAGTLGALLVEHRSFGGFSVGSGFDDAQRAEIWSRRDHYRGRTITFKYQKVGVVDKPRFPIFKGWREDI